MAETNNAKQESNLETLLSYRTIYFKSNCDGKDIAPIKTHNYTSQLFSINFMELIISIIRIHVLRYSQLNIALPPFIVRCTTEQVRLIDPIDT